MNNNAVLSLLKTRRLWPLVLAQSCGALNDNLVKNAMVVLAIFPVIGVPGHAGGSQARSKRRYSPMPTTSA